MKSGALSSARVLDLCVYRPGRLAAMLLSDQGAEVIRIDGGIQKEADEVSAFVDRGKRVHRLSGRDSVAQAVTELASESDVILFDDLSAHGLAYLEIAPLRDQHPSLVVVGVGVVDGEFSLESTLDDLVHAQTGVFTDITLSGEILGLPPTYTSLPMATSYMAVHAAIAAVAGLVRRQRFGSGDEMEVSPHASVMAAMGSVLFHARPQPVRYKVPPLPPAVSAILPVARFFVRNGGPSIQKKVRRLAASFVPPLMDFYACKNGRLIYVFAMDHSRLPMLLVQELGLEADLAKAGIRLSDPYQGPASRDNLLDAAMLSPRHRKFLRKSMAAAFKANTAEHWEDVLSSRGIPCVLVREAKEWRREPAVVEGGLMLELEDPQCGQMSMPGSFVCVGEEKDRPVPVARNIKSGSCGWAARAGQENKVSAISSSARPLEGLNILDLSTMVAGPLCARTLGELGAEVIKVDPPKPLHGPRLTAWYGMEVSHGKRSILLDLKNTAGNEVFGKLAQQADVVVHNFSQPAAEMLGIADLQDKILCSVSAFRGTRPGPWDNRKGYDPVLQAAAGVTTRFGTETTPELHGIASCVDCLTGYLGAFGVLCSVYNASASKQALPVSVSLAQGVGLIQHPFLLQPDIQAGTGDIQWKKEGYVVISYALEKAGIDYVPVLNLQNIQSAYWRGEGQAGVHFTKYSDHPCGSEVLRATPAYLRANAWRLKTGMPFPQLGTDTESVLAAQGYSADSIERLMRDGGAARSLAADYLPG